MHYSCEALESYMDILLIWEVKEFFQTMEKAKSASTYKQITNMLFNYNIASQELSGFSMDKIMYHTCLQFHCSRNKVLHLCDIRAFLSSARLPL
jgi:hypothetical protein